MICPMKGKYWMLIKTKFFGIILVSMVAGNKTYAVNCKEIFLPSQLKNEQIAEALKTNRFVVSRGLDNYMQTFGLRFEKWLENLSPDQVWIDFGAGSREAVINYLIEFGSRAAKVYALDFVKPKLDNLWQIAESELVAKSKLVNLTGKLVEDYSATEIPKFDIATDLYGPISYTENITLVLQRYLDSFRSNSSSLFVKTSYAFGLESRVGMSFRDTGTYIFTLSGEMISLTTWISRIEGVKLNISSKLNGSFILQKIKSEVIVPELEFVSSYAYGMPPVRIFKEKGVGHLSSKSLDRYKYVNESGVRHSLYSRGFRYLRRMPPFLK